MSALPTFRINGTDYRVNKYGVVFGPRIPDPHFDGWEIETEVPPLVRDRIAEMIQPAFLRWDRNDRLYSIRIMRRMGGGGVMTVSVDKLQVWDGTEYVSLGSDQS